jgi:hypothetical protein
LKGDEKKDRLERLILNQKESCYKERNQKRWRRRGDEWKRNESEETQKE